MPRQARQRLSGGVHREHHPEHHPSCSRPQRHHWRRRPRGRARIRGPNPEVSVPGAHQSRVAVDGHLSAGAGPSGPVPPSVQSKIEVMERAAQEQPAVPENRPSGGQDSDPASIPLVAATLLAGGLVAAGAGYTVYRLRHHGPVGAATA